MRVFVIGDTHFGHGNLLDKLRRDDGAPVRDFPSVEAMDAHMVAQWNRVVGPDDMVYHVGDVALRRAGLSVVATLHGRKKLILGNHDHFPVEAYTAVGFKVIGPTMVDGWLLTHYPVHLSSLGRCRGNVHGHIHEKLAPTGPYINVSVEVVDYTPVALAALRLPEAA